MTSVFGHFLGFKTCLFSATGYFVGCLAYCRKDLMYSYAVLRIRDVYPGSGFFPIPDPGSQKTWGGKKKIFYLFSYLFVAFRSCWNRSWLITVAQNLFNLITIFNYFHFLTQENIGFKLSEIMVGSGIRKKKLSRIQGSKRYRIPDPQHCSYGRYISVYVMCLV